MRVLAIILLTYFLIKYLFRIFAPFLIKRFADRIRDRFNQQFDQQIGQVMVFFVITVAACEAAVGLAMVIVLFRSYGTIKTEFFRVLRG